MSTEPTAFRKALPVLIAVGISTLLFYSGVFAFLFAVPVQVMFAQRGRQTGLTAALGTASAVIVLHSLQALRFQGDGESLVQLMLLDAMMPVGLLAGMAVYNLYRQYPWWLRLLAGGAIGVLGAVPSLRILAQASEGSGPLGEQLTAMVEMLGVQQDTDAFVSMIRRVAVSTVGVGITAALAANVWLGIGMVRRRFGGSQSLRSARVPDWMVWVVIAGLASVLAAWALEVRALEAPGWNLLLVGAFLYGLHGVGLVQHLLVRRGMPVHAERWVVTVALMLLFVPGINVVAMVALPLIGMSEVWVDYKRGETDEGHSEY